MHHPTKDKSVAVCALVKVGSNFEDPNTRGISHFIEHMVFEGTKNRSALELTQQIEGLGGEINAYTTHERTCYTIKSLKRHADRSLEILSDILRNPLFEPKHIEKERTVILSEIAMRRDQPSHYQWELFFRAVFKGYVASHPIIGYEKTVKAVTRDDLISYWKRHYTPDNMIIAVIGDIREPFRLISKHFGDMSRGRKVIPPKQFYRRLSGNQKEVEYRKINQTYSIIGFPAPRISHKDGYALEVARAILGKGMSGRLFDEIRNKRGLGYDVGAHYESSVRFGFFACHVSAEPHNIRRCESIIRKELARVHQVDAKELKEAINYLEGEYTFDYESNEKLADALCNWEYAGVTESFRNWISSIRKVTLADIRRVTKKYLTQHYAKASILAR
jgi:predicted Zn-dependent peptidase